MPADILITQLLLATARRKGPAVELRCRAVLERVTSGRELHTALQRELAGGGLTESGFRVMAALFAREPEALLRSVLAGATGLTPVRADDALLRLEMSGLVCRQRDVRDRRVVWLRLTAGGLAQAADVVQRFVAGVTRLPRDTAAAAGLEGQS
jgi:DNA-binding MarR family transcriptional regulator